MIKKIMKIMEERRMKKEMKHLEVMTVLLEKHLKEIYPLEDIAAHFSEYDIAQEVSTCDIAENIDVVAGYIEVSSYDIASEIDCEDVAGYMDVSDVAEYVAGFVEASDIANHVDLEEIANQVPIDYDEFDLSDLEDRLLILAEQMVATSRDEIMNDVINEIAGRLLGIGESE